MSEREAELRSFLQRAAQRPFIWGEDDCCLFSADWVVATLGVDPMASLRGTYSTSCEACEIIRDGSGMQFLASVLLTPLGFKATHQAAPGDIGIVVTKAGETFAIKTSEGEKWACKSPRGIVIAPFETLIAWKL